MGKSSLPKICIVCGSDTTRKAGWYKGPTCSTCYNTKYRLENKELVQANSKKQYYLNQEIYKARSKQTYYNKKFEIDYKYKRAKRTALKDKNRIWEISFEEYKLILNDGCFYCKKDLSTECGSGLDRKDNNLGYVLNNVLPCCGDCNKIKSNVLTVEEMKIAMEAVSMYRKSLHS